MRDKLSEFHRTDGVIIFLLNRSTNSNLRMVDEDNKDELSINKALNIGYGGLWNFDDAKEGFPNFEYNLYFPSNGVHGIDEMSG